MIMSSERGSMSLSRPCERALSLYHSHSSLVYLLSLSILPPFPPPIYLSPFPTASLPLSPQYWKGLGQITKKAIFIYEPEDLIDTYFMPSKSSLYYCCLCDLFILPGNIPSVEGGRVGCSECNSPWTSIILDFSTGWSSMQKGHFPSTKIKTIMMIKKTCALFVPVAWRVFESSRFSQGEAVCLCYVVWIWIQKSLHWGGNWQSSHVGETKVIALEACQMLPGIIDVYLTSKTWGPEPRSNWKGVHMGLILHNPWQMQMGAYET